MADPIDPVSSIAVKKKSVQPVWLSITVPATAAFGQYTGFVIVNAGKKYKMKVSLKVQVHLLPPASEWKFDLDLWQHPATIAAISMYNTFPWGGFGATPLPHYVSRQWQKVNGRSL